MIRVLLVDDDALVRAGLRLMLRGADGVEVVGEAADGEQATEAARALAPDVVLMDIRMPGTDGITATRRLTEDGGGAQVIVLTTFDSDTTVLDAMRAGAAGYLLKHTDPEDIVGAVHRAARGEPVLSPSAARALMDHAAASPGTGDDRTARAQERLAALSERERAVAAAVAEGLSNTEIGERLFLSTGTVKAHLSGALAKLGLDNRIQLALLAHDAQPCHPGPPGHPGGPPQEAAPGEAR
ncbi:response regulator transcription factor [Streptomyces sp. NPDC005805]|uniref:response regulator transcription factor n=1 Tax=Streptomyces sp. NPDC005805 TaxID=3157068 RepID=UPI0033D2E0DE